MRMLKDDKGKIIGVSTNDEPARSKRPEPELITTHNIEALTARRKAAADAVEAEKEGGAK